MLSMNRAIGVHGLPVSNSLLGIKFTDLMDSSKRTLAHHGGKID